MISLNTEHKCNTVYNMLQMLKISAQNDANASEFELSYLLARKCYSRFSTPFPSLICKPTPFVIYTLYISPVVMSHFGYLSFQRCLFVAGGCLGSEEGLSCHETFYNSLKGTDLCSHILLLSGSLMSFIDLSLVT